MTNMGGAHAIIAGTLAYTKTKGKKFADEVSRAFRNMNVSEAPNIDKKRGKTEGK